MMRRKKKDPNAPPPPPRDNGLPPRPPELAEAQKGLQERLGGANVAAGFGFSSADPQPKSGVRGTDPGRTACWRLFVFTDDAALQVPPEFGGFPVERRGVPKAGPARVSNRR